MSLNTSLISPVHSFPSTFDHSEEESKSYQILKNPSQFSSLSFTSSPFQVVSCISKKAIWVNFTKKVMLKLESSEKCKARLKTDCFYTTLALSVLFSGVEETKRMHKWMNFDWNFFYEFKTRSQKISFRLCAFNGVITKEVNSHPSFDLQSKEEQKAKVLEIARPCFIHFKNYLNWYSQTQEYQEKGLKRIRYNFNQATLNNLKQDVGNAIRELKPLFSCFFYIVILKPRSSNFHHAFVIEAFHSNRYHEVRFRLYQSWIHERSLRKDMKQRRYNKKDKGTWDIKEMKHFLNLLSNLCDSSEKDKDLSKECFSFSSSIPKKIIVTNKSVSALSLRYWVQKTSHENVLSNLLSFETLHKEPSSQV